MSLPDWNKQKGQAGPGHLSDTPVSSSMSPAPISIRKVLAYTGSFIKDHAGDRLVIGQLQ